MLVHWMMHQLINQLSMYEMQGRNIPPPSIVRPVPGPSTIYIRAKHGSVHQVAISVLKIHY